MDRSFAKDKIIIQSFYKHHELSIEWPHALLFEQFTQMWMVVDMVYENYYTIQVNCGNMFYIDSPKN